MADNINLVQNLFTRLESELFAGDRLSSREFVSLFAPGQFINTKGTEQNGSTDLFNQSSVLNKCIDSTFVRRDLASTIDGTYGEILEFAALPDKTTNADEDKEIQRLAGVLSDLRPSYMEFRGRYQSAYRAWLTESNRPNPDPASIAELVDKKDTALQNWQDPNQGNELAFEDALGEINYLLSGNPRTFWDRWYRSPFTTSTQSAPNGSSFHPAYLDPPASRWKGIDTPWARLVIDVNDSTSTSVSRSTSWSGGLSGGWGLWSFGADASGSTNYKHDHSDATNLHIEFEILRVDINRPWLDLNLFSRKFWAWKASHGFVRICDGGAVEAVPPVRPVGQMPIVTTEAFVVRNLKISANFSSNDSTFIESKIKSSASFGWGPFSVSGSYSESNSQQTVTGHFEGGTLTVENPQIIAFGGVLLPKSPDPDLTLPWPAGTKLTDQTLSDKAKEEILFARAEDYAQRRASGSVRAAREQIRRDLMNQDRVIEEDRDQEVDSTLRQEQAKIESRIEGPQPNPIKRK